MIRKKMQKIIVWFPLLIAVVFIIGLSDVALALSQASDPDPPIQIHLTWRQNDTAHTIVVTWKTLHDNTGDEVLYDITPRGGDPSLYDNGENGDPSETPHTYSGAGGHIHDVELTGLSPDTIYYFICGGENGGWSEERSFKTAPDHRTSFTFIVGGDSRRSGPYDAYEWDIPSFPEMRNKVSQTMAKFNPSFVIFVGDFIRDAFDQDQWDNWFEMVDTYWIDNNGLTIPIIPVIGNHEVVYPPQIEYSKENARNYYGQFCLPENERWYSLDWGPDLHITVLNSEIPSAERKGEQFDWLGHDLATSYRRWKIVTFHRPPFSGGHSNTGIRNAWVQDAFDEFHVDLVINGHIHNYERSKPINLQISEDEPQTSPENGTIYIVSGGWGAPLSSGSSEWFTAYGPEYKYHFIVVDVFGDENFCLRAVDQDGNVFDEFTSSMIYEPPEGAEPEEAEGIAISPLMVGAVIAIICVIIALYKLRKKWW